MLLHVDQPIRKQYRHQITSRAVVIKRFSLNGALLELSKFISDYLPYFEKNIYIFQYHDKKVRINL
jgi:hypothetical protein